MAKPKIALIATGGTIASLGRDPLDMIDYNEGMLEPQALLERVPQITDVADPVVVSFDRLPSHAIGPDGWLKLISCLHKTLAAQPDLHGVVITHGTATLEETAYFTHLTAKTTRPIVFVGSQRPVTGMSSDAHINLLNAFRIAAHDEAANNGVLVVMNDEIHSAREVSKRSVFRLNAFQSPDFGVLGHTDFDRIHLYRRPTRGHTVDTPFEVDTNTVLPRVDVVAAYAGVDDVAIEAFVAAGAQGLVLATHPPAVETPWQTSAVKRAIENGLVVAYATHAGAGRVQPLPSQQVGGSVRADNLSPQKARILLMLALTRSTNPADIQRYFELY